jgi:hypothetical protein
MWAAALFVLGGAIVAFGVWTLGCSGQRNGGLTLTLWAVAAGVLWPVLLLGVAEMAVIFGALKFMKWLARHVDHVPPVEKQAYRAYLDEEESVPA